MAIVQALANTFKEDLMDTTANLEANTLKVALYDNTATLSSATTAYATANEVSGSGYTAGGAAMTGMAVTLDGNTAIFDADNVSWANATITAQAAVIYNNSLSNAAIAVLDFGGNKTSTNGTFEIQFPNANASTALIRIT
jgi:plasmid replication initiation protein|tara:strand:- start:1747 stop:2166 length:420 start_codon:yes stop_codon:yes gene_type:complete